MTQRRANGHRVRLAFQLYAVGGALVGIVALALYFLRQLRVTLTTADIAILVTAGVGLAISAISIAYLAVARVRARASICNDHYVVAASNLLAEWLRFEAGGRGRLEQLHVDFNPASVRDIVAHLYARRLISQVDREILNEALRLRNELVHGRSLADRRRVDNMALMVREITRRVQSVTPACEREQGAPAH
ncbi:hypothetical protein [Pseudoduganella armeniaca]|uniref:DUF4145 domain-containing protein n=1 Tax=Pseudoduganella armeniaca TaxID=2072590 RepID=A0A2R4CE22_9BURK|nr:hypothetical protein [Pseudoduganella armeniaca]AVR97891.1 hypothetical protein C9I28_21305 [Pseudoduganella armeniaca]